jgi:F0F1-type ATP synthase membrane subunit b/b'
MEALRDYAAEIADGAAQAQRALRESKAAQDRVARDRRNLAGRAKRAGLTPSQQEQREWIKANPCGFEVA